MAFKTGGGDELNSEINVTPFVDVMLVLLIIFMITAPIMKMNTGVTLDLPSVTAQNIEDPEGKLVLSISKDDKIYLGGTQITWKDLRVKLESNERVQKESALYVEADAALPYATVLTAMSIARDAKVAKVMMLTNPSDVLKLDVLDAHANAAAGAAAPPPTGAPAP